MGFNGLDAGIRRASSIRSTPSALAAFTGGERTRHVGLHPLPDLRRGELVVVHEAGAYGASFSSRYNGRASASEVLLFPDGTLRSRNAPYAAADVALARKEGAEPRLRPVVGNRIAHEDHVGAGDRAIRFVITRDLRPVAQPRVVGRDRSQRGSEIGTLEPRRRRSALRGDGRRLTVEDTTPEVAINATAWRSRRSDVRSR